jgi:hypothetical protein
MSFFLTSSLLVTVYLSHSGLVIWLSHLQVSRSLSFMSHCLRPPRAMFSRSNMLKAAYIFLIMSSPMKMMASKRSKIMQISGVVYQR